MRYCLAHWAELVRARISGLDPAGHDVLLAAACLATPTVELVGEAAATDHDRLIELLDAAERSGIISIEGNRIRFTHPLLAGGVYTDAAKADAMLAVGARCRAMMLAARGDVEAALQSAHGLSYSSASSRVDNDQTQPPSCVTPSTSSRSLVPRCGPTAPAPNWPNSRRRG
jgi:hypothetical protein